MAPQPFVGPWPLFQFLNHKQGTTPLTEDQPVARPLPTHRIKAQTQNKRRQTSMPRAGFECTTPAFERTKIVHALDRTATVIGITKFTSLKLVNA
jgi:hypothetical protein